jgi:type-F conjugative transfer system pilin assembly protein TrbC
MEETKLLRILILIILSGISGLFSSVFSNITLAQESDLEWARGLAEGDSQIVMDNFKEIINQPGFDPELREEAFKPRPALQIFVSSSMPKQLLKNYALEAKRYGGVLVFIGLPGGSIHKLTDLIMEISSEDSAAMQIDDEAFTAFEVTSVPAIVLASSASIFEGKTASKKHDKVTGSITIKAALELFAKNGEMASDARGLLK